MSTISAGLVNAGNLTVTGTQSGAVSATNVTVAGTLSAQNITTNNIIGVQGNISISGQVFQGSQFATPPSGARSQIRMAGKDYNNTNYQAATDGAGGTLPYFRLLSQGGGNPGEIDLPQFGAFNVQAPGGNGIQQTFQGVCDTSYVYMIWEPLLRSQTYWTGTDLRDWVSLVGTANDWDQTGAALIKLDRSTGQIVTYKSIGLMMDQAYLAAGTTKAAQELAVGPGVYVADASGNPSKDASGNYNTQAVNGIDPTVAGYAGFQSVSGGLTWATAGDDNARGPLFLYTDTVLGVNCLYLCNMGQKYSSVYKIRVDTMSLIWRRTQDPFYYSYQNPTLTNSGRVMRQVMVIPPGFGRSYPVVVTGSTDNLSYSTVDFSDIQKIFNYFKIGGSVQAWADYGLTAGTSSNTNTNTPMWQTLSGPTHLTASDTLPATVFRQTTPGAPMLTVNGVTETQDTSGFIRDEDGNVSVEVFAPLMHGYVFSNGNSALTTASGCKTAGTFTLATGNRYASVTAPVYPYLGSLGLPQSAPYTYLLSEYECARFTFTDGTTFDQSGNYTGVVQNGPNVGSNITVSGYRLLCGITDSSGRNFVQTTPVQYQPIIKKIYKAQIGRLMDQWELSEFNHCAGGIYTNPAYDVDTDTFVTPTGQFVHAGAGIAKVTSKLLISDVSYNGVFYPGIHTPYTVNDISGNVVKNSYLDDSGNRQIDTIFQPAGNNFFRGIDGSGVFQSYVPYDTNLADNNLNTNYIKAALANYFCVNLATFNMTGNCDASGRLINNIRTNPNFRIPGADASGNVNSFSQASFLLNRQNAWWRKSDMVRDAANLGPFYNRQSGCGFTGIRVSDGALMFSINTNSYDYLDHSHGDVDYFGGHAPLAIYKNNGFNVDANAATIIRGLTDSSGVRRKLLGCATKSRFHLYDFNKLVDMSGNALTLTRVPGDATVDFQKGCQTNTWKNALLYEDQFGFCSPIAVFNGSGTDANNGGNNYLVDISASTNVYFYANSMVANIPGKEVHGNNTLVTNIPWNAAGFTVSDATLSGRVSVGFNGLSPSDKALAMQGVRIPTASDPSGWNAALTSGMTQFSGALTGRNMKSTNVYNLQTILNNSVSNPANNTPLNVLKYQFNGYDTVQSGFNNAGSQIYGGVVLSGNTNGILECYELANGYPVNQPKPAAGQFVPQLRKSSIGVYNQEGQRVPPMIVDGVMYGWGGANRWVRAGATGANPTKLFMWTPYGK